MEQLDDGTIILRRELSELDLFVLAFVKTMSARYVLVSGYVAILFGRSRGSENVDMIVEKQTPEEINEWYTKLAQSGFWPLNAGSPEEAYELLKDNIAVRFAVEGKVIPYMEVKFVTSSPP